MAKSVAIDVKNVYKRFDVADGQVTVLKNISFQIEENEFVVIFGPSGCGKSTLLHTVLGLEKPTDGVVKVLGESIYEDYSENDLADFRKHHLGMVYQQANWIKSINVIENVAFPLVLLGESQADRVEKAKQMLKSVGMLDWAAYHPSELSSGQQQRVSLARALITNPEIIIADEPTGNLDFESGEDLMSLLVTFSKKANKTIVMVTHDLEYLKYADKAIRLFDGGVKKIFSPRDDIEELKDINKKRKVYEEITAD